MEQVPTKQEQCITSYMNFETELATIVNNEIRSQCEKVLSAVDKQFFIAPASSTGKYHPDYALGEGGLYRHTCAAVKIANSLLELDGYKKDFSEDLQDYIRAALILHDTCKSGIVWESEHTVFEHPLLVKELMLQVLGDCEFTQTVDDLVKTHMGQWTTSKYSKIVLQSPQSAAQLFVHTCDYLASRKFIEVKL